VNVGASHPFPLFRKCAALLSVAVSLLVLSGCQTAVTVRINQLLDGTGDVTVTALLDREAVEQAGDLRAVLQLQDLEAAGWSTAGPVPRPPGGFVAYTATKSFRNSGEAQLIMEELTGDDGPFSGLVLDRTRSPLRIVSSVKGQVDLTSGYEVFGDEGISQVFQSESKLGVSVEDIEARYGSDMDDLLPLSIEMNIEGSELQRIDLPAGVATPVSLRSVTWNRLILFPLAAIAMGVLGLLISFRRRAGDD
jgi:hypothetical protein